jgi:hypothetical protein
MDEKQREPEPLREEDVGAFMERLREWSEELSETDQALLRLIVARAEGSVPLTEELGPASKKGHNVPPIDYLTKRLLDQLIRARMKSIEGFVWLLIPEPWLKSTGELEEEL